MFKKNTSLLKLLRAGCLFACSIYSSSSFADTLHVRVKVEGKSKTPRANNYNRNVSNATEPIAPDSTKFVSMTKFDQEYSDTNINCSDFKSLMPAIAKGMIGAIKQEGNLLATPEQIVKAINAKREEKLIECLLDTNNPAQSLDRYTSDIQTPEDLKKALSELGDLTLFASRIGFVIDMDAVMKPVLCAQKEYRGLAASMSGGKIKTFNKFISMNVLPTVIDRMVENMPAGMTESFLRSLKNSDGTARSDLLGMLEDVAFTLSGTIDNEWEALLNALYESVQDKKSLVFKVSSSSRGQIFKDKHLADIENLLCDLLPDIYKDKNNKPTISLIENDSEYKVSTVSIENMETAKLNSNTLKKFSNNDTVKSGRADYPGFEAEQSLRSQLSIWSAHMDDNYIDIADDSKQLLINHIKNFWVDLLEKKVIPEFWKMQNNSNNKDIDINKMVTSLFEKFSVLSENLVIATANETSKQVLEGLFSRGNSGNAIMSVAIGGGSPLLGVFRHNDSGAQNPYSPNAINSNATASSVESFNQRK